MTLTVERLSRQLSRPFKYLDSVESTNDVAKTWLLEGAPELACVIADEQRRGRGRKGRVWHTPPGVALAISIILRPPARLLPRVNMIGALSVCDLARQVGCSEVGIKWPNDVQVQGRKVSGILPESIWEDNKLVGVALGVGINVRMNFKGTGLENKAISLEDIVNDSLDRTELTVTLLERVEHWYRLIDTDEIFATWKSRLNMLQKRMKIDGLEGISLDVTPDGELLVQDARAKIHRVSTGEIAEVQEAWNR